MADLETLIDVFHDQGWSCVSSDDGASILTRFADSHAAIDLVLRLAADRALAISASSIARVTKEEMAAVLGTLGTSATSFTWGRDPTDGSVWVESTVSLPDGEAFAHATVEAIDRCVVAIDGFRSALLSIHELLQHAGFQPKSVDARPLVALSGATERALFQFVRTNDLQEARRLIEQHGEILTPAADDKLRRMVSDQVSDAARRRVTDRRTLLSRVRELGMEAAFETTKNNVPANTSDPHTLNAVGDALREAAAEGPSGDVDRRRAIECFQAARTILEAAGDRLGYAHVSYNLGNAFADMHEDREANIERAIACYRETLDVYDREDPELRYHWATAHYELGLAFGNRRTGGKRTNLEQAVQHYREALRVFAPGPYPKEFGCCNQNMAADLLELRRLP